MSTRIPYEMVIVESEKILNKFLLGEDMFDIYQEYIQFIEACGWEAKELQQEIQNRAAINLT